MPNGPLTESASARVILLRATLRLWPYLVIIAVVVLANAVSILVTDPDPMVQRSGLPISQGSHLALEGQSSIDPNDGFTTQALGVESARQLLSGELPLWNHDEGIGQPLAGGMQAASLFPFTLLMLLPDGVLVFHLVLEILAGIGMYLLLRRMRLHPTAALAAGALFALNGTFAWLTNAVFNPIAFLPWLLFGIELARESEGWRRARGWWLVAISVALSLYAGFPEVAYLDTLLAVGWALTRLPGVRRKAVYLVSVGAGAAAGALLALPVLGQFILYLPDAELGGHSSGWNGVALPLKAGLALLIPYVFGPIFGWGGQDPSGFISNFWGSVGGYLTMGAAGLALVGVFARLTRMRLLQLLLLVWSILAVGRIYGVPGLRDVVNLVPGINSIAAYRYLPPSLEAAVIVLAAFGLHALLTSELRRPVRIALGAVFGAVAIIVVVVAARVSHGIVSNAAGFRQGIVLWGAVALIAAFIVAVAVAGVRRAVPLVAPIVVIEAMVLFLAPQVHAPTRPVTVDLAPVTFLQQHLGEGRVFGFTVLQPNYGTYFDIASINDNNLPVPKDWADMIDKELIPSESSVSFNGGYPDPGLAKGQFFQNVDRFEALGVKYLIAPVGFFTPAEKDHYDFTTAFQDTSVEVLQLPDTAPYFSADGCTVSSSDRDRAVVNCTSASTLSRLELYLPGWRASIDGKRTAAVVETDDLQAVKVPAGRHVVTYEYWPPLLTVSFLIAGATAVLLIAAGALGRLRSRRRPAPVQAAQLESV